MYDHQPSDFVSLKSPSVIFPMALAGSISMVQVTSFIVFSPQPDGDPATPDKQKAHLEYSR